MLIRMCVYTYMYIYKGLERTFDWKILKFYTLKVG